MLWHWTGLEVEPKDVWSAFLRVANIVTPACWLACVLRGEGTMQRVIMRRGFELEVLGAAQVIHSSIYAHIPHFLSPSNPILYPCVPSNSPLPRSNAYMPSCRTDLSNMHVCIVFTKCSNPNPNVHNYCFPNSLLSHIFPSHPILITNPTIFSKLIDADCT